MSLSSSELTTERACRLGEESKRRGISLMDAVQEFRRNYSVSEPMVHAFSVGWIAASFVDRPVSSCAEGAD